MKKLFAIVTLFAILFNSGGNSLFFQFIINRWDNQTIDRINRNHKLVELNLPINLPEIN